MAKEPGRIFETCDAGTAIGERPRARLRRPGGAGRVAGRTDLVLVLFALCHVVVMIAVGGMTRLTDSVSSITGWALG